MQKNLSEIKTCAKTFDIRDVFDTKTGPIYWDQGHVSDRGNSIVAKSLFDIVFFYCFRKLRIQYF